jgi:PAS domain S-box-containing protein
MEQVNQELHDYKFALDQVAVVTITDVDGEIIYVNDKFCELSKYSREELIGQTHRIINSGYHPKELFKDLWDTVGAGKIWKNEVKNKAKDGTCYWADTTIVPFLDGDKRPYQYLAIRVDITQRKEMEEELKEALEAKSQFVSLVSHELRTPLTAIKQGIDIVDSGTTGEVNDQQREFLGLAKSNVDRLTRLINGILDFQKLQAGKMEFSMEKHNLNKAATEIYKTMKPLTEDKGLNLIITTDERLPKIRFDRDKIIQVMTNFLNNAVKFTDEGSIEIAIERKDNVAHVMVKDTGIGFSEEDKGKLFKSFEQLESGKKYSGGTGLGLAISKQIIDGHSGKIWATSQKGRGSVFHFALPVVERRERG